MLQHHMGALDGYVADPGHVASSLDLALLELA